MSLKEIDRNSSLDFKTSDIEKPEESSGYCAGKKVTPCLTQKNLATAAVVAGVILLILGAFGLMAHFTPAGCSSTVMLNIQAAATAFAAKVGSDLLTLTIFSASFGAGFALCGTVGLIVERCRQPKEPEYTIVS